MAELIHTGQGIWQVKTTNHLFTIHEGDAQTSDLLVEFQNNKESLDSFGEMLEEHGVYAYHIYKELEIPEPPLEPIPGKGQVTDGKRGGRYIGTTNSSGEYTVAYDVPYSTVPCVIPSLIGTNYNRYVYVSSSTTEGFTIKVVQRDTLNALSLEVLDAALTNVNGATVNVIVSEM